MKHPLRLQRHVVDLLFTISLFCVFTITGLGVVIAGANIYEDINNTMEEHDTSRTCAAYLRSKVRQNDRADRVCLKTMPSGETALVLTQRFYEAEYETWIFHHENALKELFIQKGNPPQPESGQEIFALKQFDVALVEQNQLKLEFIDLQGKTHLVVMNLQSDNNSPPPKEPQ